MKRIVLVIALCAFGLMGQVAVAEDAAVTLTYEQNIGIHCPTMMAQQPDTTTAWVMLDDCFGYEFELMAFDMMTGAPVLEEPLSLAIDGDLYAWPFNSTDLAFLADGSLELILEDTETAQNAIWTIDLQSGELTPNEDKAAAVNALLDGYSEFVTFAIFSPNHVYAAPVTEDGIASLVNIETGQEIVSVQMDGLTLPAAFSSDNTRVYFSVPDDPEHAEESASVSVYRTSDGALLNNFVVPASVVHPNRDGSKLVLEHTSPHSDFSEIAVMNPETGMISPFISIWEPQSRVLKCANNGRNTDGDYTFSGALMLTGLLWLADDSGFVTVNSYGGDGVTNCVFSYSRLRQYMVSGV